MRPLDRFLKRLPIAWRFIIPFVGISLLTTILLGASYFYNINNTLTQTLEEKSRILTRNLATELSDPLTMGQTDKVQEIVEAARVNDDDLLDATVQASNGHVIASTDRHVLELDRRPLDSFEEMAFKSRIGLKRPGAQPGKFEFVVPVRAEYGPTWLVSADFSDKRVRDSIHRSELFAAGIGALSLILGITFYVTTISNEIIVPISNVARVAGRISNGDLGETVEVTRADEIGQLLQSMNGMVADLRERADVAHAIARGELDVQVESRGEKDVFGNAFQSMVKSLKEQRTELAARETRFRSLCLTSPVAIFESDADGIVSFANDRWVEMSGLPIDEILNQEWYQAVHPADRPKIIRAWQALRDDPGVVEFSAEFLVLRPDGSVRCGHCLATRLEGSGYVGTIEDVSKHKQQEEINKRLALLEQREEFMATLTHDLKNPLIGANRVLDLLARQQLGEVDERHADLLFQLMDSNKRLLAMIQNLIDAYRYEKDVHSLMLDDTDLSKIVMACLDEIAPIAKNKEIAIEAQIPESVPSSMVDGNAIRRVLQNLIDNSLKFTPRGGRISVTIRQKHNALVVKVQDTGLGIAPEEQEHLFKRFSQGRHGRRYTPGSGLGLYLCKQIIEAHKGTIQCHSKQGRGTVFEISLPDAQNLA